MGQVEWGPMAEARSRAAEHNRALTLDERFNRSVEVRHADESMFHFRHAFCVREGDFLFVYAEHFPPMVFAVDDLEEYREVQPQAEGG
jgi:hypothetical protein